MPSPARKLLVCAAADGLLLQPLNPKDQSPESNAVRLAYGTNRILSSTERVEDESKGRSLEAHGIVGLLDLVSTSYLISITRREQVALIRGKPVYAISDVTFIPLSSQQHAGEAIINAQKSVKGAGTSGDESGYESDGGEDVDLPSPSEEHSADATALEPEPPKSAIKKSTSFVKDVVQDKGQYGRFASKWFSTGGWKANGRRRQGISGVVELKDERREQAEEALSEDEQSAHGSAEKTENAARGGVEHTSAQSEETSKDGSPAPRAKNTIETLTPRILRTARLYFSSSSFFFAYDYNLSAAVSRPDASFSLPLCKRFDDAYFWNRHLMHPFIDAGQTTFVLPLLQGFVGQRGFSIAKTEAEERHKVAEAAQGAQEVVAAQKEATKAPTSQSSQKDFLLTLISRRSVKRAGLRYLRRGIDDEGNVANYVETEQILSTQAWSPTDKLFSLVQIRGSIPLFFSQSPYSFKPLPTMFGSEATNQAAFKRHFASVTKRYGSVHCASLVDKHATEAPIGKQYEQTAKWLNDQGGVDGKPVGFEWFDFHSACKGMKFENVSILLYTLQSSLKHFGWTVRQSDRDVRKQTGVLRTNCMDCLDRTNVTQSSVAGWALQQQLAELDLSIDLKTDTKTQWFNTLWADNGDAISKQYAGTAALKGDFTRTRKRNWTGALSDFSLTLNRYYNNIFGDYFLQLNIDYFLGNATPAAFDDFETDMRGQDYAFDMRKLRQNAIDTCIKIVLEDPKEDLVAGWTLSCPHEANTLRSLPFEECVLLLTDTALYHCRFDWATEKVGSFERINLIEIVEIWKGPYITSVLGPTHTDENKNVGFALRYNTSGRALVRTNTRTQNNEKPAADETQGKSELAKQDRPEQQDSRLLAFKALPLKTSAAKHEGDGVEVMAEEEFIRHVCHELYRTLIIATKKQQGAENFEPDKIPQVQDKAVVTVADARKATGYIESIGYSLKKLVWY